MESSRERLVALRKRSGYDTAKDAAVAFGWNVNTYHAHENGNAPVSKKAAERYADAYRTTAAYILYGTAPDAETSISPTLTPIVPTGHTIKVVGEVQAGAWKDAVMYDEDEVYDAPIERDPKYASFEQYGLKVRGNSMDMLFKEGSIVVCISIWQWPAALTHDLCVVVERANNGHHEATVKQIEIAPNGTVKLWPRSSSPKHQDPIVYDADSEETKITGVVIGSYSPAPGLAG